MKPVVVHIVSTLQSSGPQRIVLDLSSTPELASFNHKVICVFARRGELTGAFQDAGIKTMACPFPISDELPIPSYRVARWVGRKLEPTFPARFASALRRMKADVVHTHVSSRIDLQATGAMIKAGLPMVWTIHGLQTKSPENILRRKRAADLIKNGRGAIAAVSKAVADDIAGDAGLEDHEIRVVFGGIDLSRFRNPASGHSRLRESLKISSGAAIFGAVGLLQHEKGHDIFIEAAHLLNEKAVDAHFAVAGPGKLHNQLLEAIAQKGLTDRFHLLGFRNDIPALLREFDVFVLPSRKEGLPLALLEALASGLPCIASAVGGIPEILNDGGGILVPPESPEKLAEAMELLLSSQTRRCCAASATEIAGKFSINASAANYARIYNELLQG